MNKNVVLDLDQIKVIERLIALVAEAGLSNFDITDIQKLLKCSKKLTYKCAIIEKATKKEVEKSGLLCEELHHAHKYLINIESGKDMSLADIDTIACSFHDFEERTPFVFGTSFDEFKKHEFQIDLFIVE